LRCAARLDSGRRPRFPRRYEAETGLPRVWGPKDDIRAACVKAKHAAREILALYIEDEARDFNGGVPLLTDEEAEAIDQQLDTEVNASYQTAKLAQEALMVHSRTPTWMLALLAILGANEFFWIITSPLIMLLIATGAALLAGLQSVSPGLPMAIAQKAKAMVVGG